MVDVGKVTPVTGVVDLIDALAFSPMWFACQRRLNNVLLTTTPSELEGGRKFSWRLLYDMFVDLEGDVLPEWSRIEWMLIDLKKHTLTELGVRGLQQISFDVMGRIVNMPLKVYGFSKTDKPALYAEVTAVQERQYNQEIMKLFGSKFPIKLEKMSPIRGSVQLSVPVEERRRPTEANEALAALRAASKNIR